MAGCVRVNDSEAAALGNALASAINGMKNATSFWNRVNYAKGQIEGRLINKLPFNLPYNITLLVGSQDTGTPSMLNNLGVALRDALNGVQQQECSDKVVAGTSCYDATIVREGMRRIESAMQWLTFAARTHTFFNETFGCSVLQYDFDVPLLPNMAIYSTDCLKQQLDIAVQFDRALNNLLDSQGIFEGKIECKDTEPTPDPDPDPPPPPPPPPPPTMSDECCDKLTTAINNLSETNLDCDLQPVLNAITALEAALKEHIDSQTTTINTKIESKGDEILEAIEAIDVDLKPILDKIDALDAKLSQKFRETLDAIAGVDTKIDTLLACCARLEQGILDVLNALSAAKTEILAAIAALKPLIENVLTEINNLKQELITKIDELSNVVQDVLTKVEQLDTKVTNEFNDLNQKIDTEFTELGDSVSNVLKNVQDLAETCINNFTAINDALTTIKELIEALDFDCNVDLKPLSDKFDADIQLILNRLNLDATGNHQMTVCDPRQDVWIAGQPKQDLRETKSYQWGGQGLQGLLNALNGLRPQINDMATMLCQIAEVSPVFHVTDPSEKYQEFKRMSELKITYVREGTGLKRSAKDSTWHLHIPNPRQDITWDDIAPLIYPKGTYPGKLRVIGQKEVALMGYFLSKEDAFNYFDLARTLSVENFEETPRVTLSGSSVKRTVKEETLYPISATMVIYDDESNIVEAKCFRPY